MPCEYAPAAAPHRSTTSTTCPAIHECSLGIPYLATQFVAAHSGSSIAGADGESYKAVMSRKACRLLEAFEWLELDITVRAEEAGSESDGSEDASDSENEESRATGKKKSATRRTKSATRRMKMFRAAGRVQRKRRDSNAAQATRPRGLLFRKEL
ncbi:hypothetical protein K438DRAFT_1762641 [Mycena galopus ATCC 62051]|nr:hypothetical protein K438DRAFT_1762641 [Mycena galopus ATCC 62051]